MASIHDNTIMTDSVIARPQNVVESRNTRSQRGFDFDSSHCLAQIAWYYGKEPGSTKPRSGSMLILRSPPTDL